MGDKLPGTQGKSIKDQKNIDDTVARGCSTNIYIKDKCATHTKASEARYKELRSQS